ncbi:D-arabinose 1-dehydrogenase, Zn-dependent alcohol dehydrogenase family [Micromonospora inositola]|uniref:D-arabinose 1-dehydrogenase, Zn-dependent alcohol dehydrogenase family n=1 Tax=Micromonospora inositola TaxID=47865 RepID=A0A1C5JNQ3_9ACTN|nr:D-arabinose 1-dehydrogenase, Zn-dependent alcohol dehydrogenase family [Micromonospora inositola]
MQGDSMWAALLVDRDGQSRAVVERVPVPVPSEGEVLVRMSRAGICGSDVSFALTGKASTSRSPLVLGHEAVGVVVAAGPGDPDDLVGVRVSLLPRVVCARCPGCQRGHTVQCREQTCLGVDRDGAFAEYVVLPAANCLPVPDGLSDELAAVAADAVATAYHAVVGRGRLRSGDRVAIWGVGGLGLSAVGLAKTLGASRIVAVDPRPQARAWALATGADEVLGPADAAAFLADRGGVDIALEFAGRPETAEAAVRALDHGGRAVLVGVGPGSVGAGRLMSLVLRERAVLGSYGSEPFEARAVLELLASGRLELPHLVGDTIGLADVPRGLERVRDGDLSGSRLVVAIS